jgi:adenylate cyclase
MKDLGPTPISAQTFFVSTHWNVADMLLSNRFIAKMPFWMDFFLVLGFSVLSTGLTWRLRTLHASSALVLFCAAYIAAAAWLYIDFRFLVPVALPVVAALLLPHLCMVTYRAMVEQQEKRRVKSVFEKLVSPNVVNELLDAEKLTLGGARRRLTVYFADVRGFTEMTDQSQVKAEEHVAKNNLTGSAAEEYFDEQAREVLSTVNLYLSSIADMVKKHNGTLDKYIGDCVMAFWGEPTPNQHHALECVRSAIDSQRAIAELNEKRLLENQRREQENTTRIQEGQPPLPFLSVLSLGSGINTGVMTVGLMGSDAHIYNYTVFGREVNLASRLEGVSGRGRIIISESTYADLQRDDPTLAATCVEQPSVMVKGISKPVKIYVVPWRIEAGVSDPSAQTTTAAAVLPPDSGSAAPSKSESNKI